MFFDYLQAEWVLLKPYLQAVQVKLSGLAISLHTLSCCLHLVMALIGTAG